MKTMATQTQLVNAIKQAGTVPPWNLLDAVEVYNANKHQYALRASTMVSAVRIYPAILEAAALCGSSIASQNSTYPYRMIIHARGSATEICTEVGMPDGTSYLILASENKIRISVIETDGTFSPSLPFKDLDSSVLK